MQRKKNNNPQRPPPPSERAAESKASSDPAISNETAAAAATTTAPITRKRKRHASPTGWIMSLSSAALMIYCAYVTMIAPSDTNESGAGAGAASSSSSSAVPTTTTTNNNNNHHNDDDGARPLFQRRYFRDSALWHLPNRWEVREDASLAAYRFDGTWSSLRPDVYFGMKSQPAGLSGGVQGSLATGMMWMRQATNFLVGGEKLKVRHDTSDGGGDGDDDALTRFEWVRHDGQHYGVQRLRDPAVVGGDLYTAFVSSVVERGGETRANHTTSGWMQMFQTLPIEAPAPSTTTATAWHSADAREWERRAHQDVRPVTSVWYMGADCAEEADRARLERCHDRLTVKDVHWAQVRSDHFQLHGRTDVEGRFVLDFVIASSLNDGEEKEARPSLDIQLAMSSSLDLSSGVQQLLKELREPHMFNSHQQRSSHRHHQLRRVFIDDFGDWRRHDPSDDERGEEEEEASRFLAVTFTLPPGQRVLVHYHSSLSETRAIEGANAATLMQAWTEASHAAYQHFERRFVHLMRQKWDNAATVASSSSSSSAEEDDTDAILASVMGDASPLDSPRSTENGNGKENGKATATEEAAVLEDPVYTADDVEVIKMGLSSLLGGMGTFMGQATISTEIIDSLEPHRNHPALDMQPGRMTLTTATPSRTVFPRGFLWDEGFHQLVIATWRPALTLQTIADWLHAMYLAPHHSVTERRSVAEAERADEFLGWIPREMILGPDARRRVPAEFIPQRVDIANPPTFFLVLRRLLRDTVKKGSTDDHVPSTESTGNVDEREDGTSQPQYHQYQHQHQQQLTKAELAAFLVDIYPRLHAWVQWFLFTQAGDEPGSFRWRGRSADDRKYIANTLSSGLDDYPRSLVPTVAEKHVDLHAWMIVACDTMVEIDAFLADIHGPTAAAASPSSASSPSSSSRSEQNHNDDDSNNNNLEASERDCTNTDEAGGGKGGPDAQKLAQIRLFQTRGQYAEYAQFLRTRLHELHWFPDLPTPGYFDVGATNETAGLPLFVLDVVCRCVDPVRRDARDIHLPMDSLHVLFQQQQERQRLLQEHQQLQQQRKKNKLPPITESPELPPLPPICPASHPQFVGPLQGDGVHGLQTRESLDRSLILQQGAVPRLGYVSLFPFLLQVLDVVEHPETLEHALRLMEPASFSSSSMMGVDGSNEPAKESLLWTPFGLRSLASADSFYQRRNAPGDAPYWRGPIWININYLALSSLHHYAALPATPPALRHRCARLYRTLRHHLLRNLLKNYHETGFFWEQYDDVTGQGIRGHPFTGWTATVVNIFTENY